MTTTTTTTTTIKKGGCLCGAVRYETWGEPFEKCICHCPFCKKLSGAVFSSQIIVHRDNYKITKGETNYYSMYYEGHYYGNTFCRTCGSTVCRDTSAFPDIIVVKLGTLDELEDQNWAKPTREVYTDTRVSWVPCREDCAQVPKTTTELPGVTDAAEPKTLS